MTDQQPFVGRIVHYVARGSADGVFESGACRAAIVTHVYGRLATGSSVLNADLAVINPGGMFFDKHVQFDSDNGTGTWHWPELA